MRMNIEAERARNGMTKTKLSQILGISLPTYNSYVSGSSIPSDVLDKMADLFGTTSDYLLRRYDQPNLITPRPDA